MPIKFKLEQCYYDVLLIDLYTNYNTYTSRYKAYSSTLLPGYCMSYKHIYLKKLYDMVSSIDGNCLTKLLLNVSIDGK